MILQERRLLKHTVIYGIGNIGTKIIAYIMVLVYSYYIKSEELGYYDLVLTTVSMIQPLVMIGINEATFRFMIGNTLEGKSDIVATSSKFIICSSILSGLAFAFVGYHLGIDRWQLVLFFGITTIIYAYNQEAVRGYEKPQLYASLGIINSVITLLIEFVGLVILNRGIGILLVSKAISNIICIIITICKTNLLSDVVSVTFDKTTLKNMLRYSAPLVPNAMCWWIMNSSDRYIIRASIGASANGIYAISYKFPTILITISSVFYLAWQESAVTEYNSKNRDYFFSKVFNNYYQVLFSLAALLIPFTRTIVTLFISKEYRTAWVYSCPLILSAAFSALCSFFGIGYQVSKDTVRALFTMIIAAITNVVVNLALVHSYGLHAASISTLIAFIVLFILRLCQARDYYVISYDWKKMLLLIILCMISWLTTVLLKNNFLLYLYCCIILIFAVIFNRGFLRCRE